MFTKKNNLIQITPEPPEPALTRIIIDDVFHVKDHILNSENNKILCGYQGNENVSMIKGDKITLNPFIATYQSGAYCSTCSKEALAKYSKWIDTSFERLKS